MRAISFFAGVRHVAIGLIALACGCAAQAQHSLDRAARWQADLTYLHEHLADTGYTFDFQRGISTRGQVDFKKLYPDPLFTTELEHLKAEASSLSDPEIVLRLMRLIASANVAHNMVALPRTLEFDRRLPVALYWFSDGLAVAGAGRGSEATLGAHVVRIGSMTPAELLGAVTPYISHENEAGLLQAAPEYVRCEPVLRHFNLIDPDGRVRLTLQKNGEAPFELPLEFADSRLPLTLAIDALHVPTPLYRTALRKHYWYRYLPDSRAIYIQYNVCESDSSLPFEKFVGLVLADADAHQAQRVVIDLRFNGGGDSRVIKPLVSALASRRKSIGTVDVLIGRGTFSSAVQNAAELRQALHAKLLGEAAGGKPSSYGEVKMLTLPNAGLVIRYTSKNFGSSDDVSTQALAPDLPISLTLADWLAGADPVLAAALAN